MNRLGILCFYDKNGIVDDYLEYLLDDLTKNLTRLIIVVNGQLTNEGKIKLEKFTNEIFIRENNGLDAWAWKYALDEIGFDVLQKYDELLLFNDTFYGPLYPFEQVFAKMADKQCDFWGLTIHGENKGFNDKEIYPEHLQSYFLIIRQRMSTSKYFKNYWQKLPEINNFADAVAKNEVVFTKYFFDLGYTYSVLCDTREDELEYATKINHYAFNQVMLLGKYNFPVIKRKVLVLDKTIFLNYNMANEQQKALEYINENTNYDINLIYKCILRNYNASEIKASFNLIRVLPTNTLINNQDAPNKKIAIFAYLCDKEASDNYCKYIKNIDFADVYLLTGTSEEKTMIENHLENIKARLKIKVVETKENTLVELINNYRQEMLNCDYVCLIQNEKPYLENKFVTVEKVFNDLFWNNILASKQYAINAINILHNDKNIGLLVPPLPKFSIFLDEFCSNYWTKDIYKRTLQLKQKLGIKSDISMQIPSLAITSASWFKVDALKTILEYDWKQEECMDLTTSYALKRLLPYIAQDAGYLTAEILTNDFAQDELENLCALFKNESILHKRRDKKYRKFKKTILYILILLFVLFFIIIVLLKSRGFVC